MKALTKAIIVGCLAIGSKSSMASGVEFGENGNNLVKTTAGAWSYNERINFTEAGTYTMNFKDLNFGEQYDYVGAMISTPAQQLASVVYEDGILSNTTPIEFQAGEQEYWLSMFAFSNSANPAGTFGLEITSVSEVPGPPALLLMLSSLFGLVALSRRKAPDFLGGSGSKAA